MSRNLNLFLLSLQGATLSSLNPLTPKLDAHQCKFLQAFLLKAPLGKLLKLLKLALCYRSNSVNLNTQRCLAEQDYSVGTLGVVLGEPKQLSEVDIKRARDR